MALPGVHAVIVNPATAMATVRFDPARTTAADLKAFVEPWAYHCWGERAPGHRCPATGRA